MIEAVLFDLDGTLIDTAPDMGAALNNLLLEEGFDRLPIKRIRPLVSQGGMALTRLGFEEKVEEADLQPLLMRYLQHYRSIVADSSTLFQGFDSVLQSLESRDLKWGIVTNKPEWLTIPLLEGLNLKERCAVVICGDTLEKKKPHPLPLIEAARRISVDCCSCIYIGDDERDIIAGNAAEMKTLIATYGYIPPHSDLAAWNAHGTIDQPLDLINHSLLTKLNDANT